MDFDFNSIIAIIVGLVAVYLFVKFVVNPLLKAALGVVIFLILIYIFQRIFNLDLTKIFGPFAPYLDLNNWGSNISWLLAPLNNYISKAISFFQVIWKNIPK